MCIRDRFNSVQLHQDNNEGAYDFYRKPPFSCSGYLSLIFHFSDKLLERLSLLRQVSDRMSCLFHSCLLYTSRCV